MAIDSRVAARKRAAQAAAQKEYEKAVGAQHALLLKEEGNGMRKALQEKASKGPTHMRLSGVQRQGIFDLAGATGLLAGWETMRQLQAVVAAHA